MNHRFKALIASASLVLSACSARKTAYKWADVYFASEVDNYFDLSTAQKAETKSKLMRHMSWHKNEELPRIAKIMSEAQVKAIDGLERAELTWFLDALKDTGHRIVAQLAPDVGVFLSTLTEEQIEHVAKVLEKRNKSQVQKNEVTPSEALSQRTKDMAKKIRVWTGPLSQGQTALIEAYVRQGLHLVRNRFEHRVHMQKLFLSFLRQKPDPFRAETEVKLWLLEATRFQEIGLREELKADGERFVSLILALDKSLTREQRGHFNKEIVRLKADIMELAIAN